MLSHRRKLVTRARLAAALVALSSSVFVLAAASAQGATRYEAASIIPANTFGVGNALPGGPDGRGYGYAITANGIDGTYTASSSAATYAFLFIVFSSASAKQKVSFTVLSPANKVVFSHSYTLPVGPVGNWAYVSAKGTYAKAGTYLAEVRFGKQLLGWIPLTFYR